MTIDHAIDHSKARRALARRDPTLGGLMKVVGPCTLQPTESTTVFSVLAEAIVYQQLHARAAETIHGRVLATCGAGDSEITSAHVLATSDESLRTAGLSRAKAASLRDLAMHDATGTLPTFGEIGEMSDDEIVARFTAVRGIGRWTAHMFLIFRLGRPDVLPVDDYAVRRAFGIVYQCELPTPKQLEAHGEQWAPYRTVASWYLWRALELPAT